MKAKYKDELLNSLHAIYCSAPDNLTAKKSFALGLVHHKEYKDAYPLLKELRDLDPEVHILKAIKEVEMHLLEHSPGGEPIALASAASMGETKFGVTFDSVAGMSQIKEAIRTAIIYPYQHPELFQKYKKAAGGGLLLYGPPGCGKTFIGKALAGEIKAEFIIVSIHEILSKYIGESEKAIHAIFEQARDRAPAVLFFDEIDALGSVRGRTQNKSGIVNQLLTEMDGLNSGNSGMMVIGATNLPWEVDAALRRPGRFDTVMFVEPPDLDARMRIFELNLKDLPCTEDIDMEELARLASGFSCSDIVRVCEIAAEGAFKQAIVAGTTVPLNMALLLEAVSSVLPSTGEWFATINNYIRYSNQGGYYESVQAYMEKKNANK
ncbi:MAG: ATP-binding protein [bacterium]|nr:ATP-binding protein [bacterium]